MSIKIQHRRGSKANLPTLASGELGLCTDTNEVFIGGDSGNLQLAVADACSRFEALSNDVANKTVDTCVTSASGYDTWTSVITRKSDGVELARRVDVESATADGYCVWTSTITIAGKASVTWKATQTSTGWIKEVV